MLKWLQRYSDRLTNVTETFTFTPKVVPTMRLLSLHSDAVFPAVLVSSNPQIRRVKRHVRAVIITPLSSDVPLSFNPVVVGQHRCQLWGTYQISKSVKLVHMSLFLIPYSNKE